MSESSTSDAQCSGGKRERWSSEGRGAFEIGEGGAFGIDENQTQGLRGVGEHQTRDSEVDELQGVVQVDSERRARVALRRPDGEAGRR